MSITPQRGMVISVDLNPTKGHETDKVRPCVVVSNDDLNKHVPVIQVSPITVANEKKLRIVTNVALYPNQFNGLTKESVVDCLQTRPVDYQKRNVGVLGRLDAQQMDAISTALKKIFDLN